MTIDTRITRLEKRASSDIGTLPARIIAARAPGYRHKSTAELEAVPGPSKLLSRIIAARKHVGIR